MKAPFKALLVFNALLIGMVVALGQTSPHLYNGQIPSSVQWNSYFSAKQDYPVPVFSTTTRGSVPISPGGTTTFLRADGTFAVPSGSSVFPANPTATIGAAPVNGTATTYMRSDAAPALPSTLPALNGSQLTNLTINNLAGLGTGVSTALTTNVSGTGAICLASGSACTGNPAGSSGQLQFNNSGAFGAISGSSCTTSLCTLTSFILSGPTLSGTITFSGITGSVQCLHVDSSGHISGTGSDCGAGSGTLTATGSPANGNLAKWSSATSLTNGDLSGDCTTSGTLAITCTKSGGVSLAPSATIDTTNATNITSGTLADARLSTNVRIRSFGTTFGDTTGTTLSSGSVVYFTVPYSCTIAAWNITIDTGTATIDVWKIASGTAVPTVANTITAAAKPAISTGTAIHSTTLTGWTTSVTANDIFGIQLNAVASARFVEFDLQCNL